MIRKAGDSLDSAHVLLGFDHFDGAANRAYYAAYQVGWHYLEVSGYSAPGTHWPHSVILEKLEDEGIRPFDDWEQSFDLLQNERVKADYSKGHVQKDVAGRLVDHAQQFVDWIKTNAPN